MTNPHKLWTAMLARCRTGGVPHSTMVLWLEPAKPLRVEDNRLVLEFPPGIFAWAERRYAHLLGDAARAEGLAGVRITQATGDDDGR